MKQLATYCIAVCLMMVIAMPTAAHGVRLNHMIDETTGEITVTAEFDTGEVLNDAAVVIYAPDDLINPWQTGSMDDSGSYTFMPDYSIEGFWDIQIRKAGHGGLINVEITEEMMPDTPPESTPDTASDSTSTLTLSDGSQIVISGDAQFQVNGDIVISATGDIQQAGNTASSESRVMSSGSGFTTTQILIMSISVIWGFIGTALYFSGRRSGKSAE